MRTEKKRTVKGAVLFTVVSVMSLLIIFLTGTLMLATSAHQRANKTYASSQANYTARAAIDSILAALENDGFATKVETLAASSTPIKVDVNVGDGLSGTVTNAEVAYAGKQQYYNSVEKKWEEKDLISITADVTYAKETKTIMAYVIKDPPPTTNNSGGGGGFVTAGTAKMENHTNAFGGSYLGIGMNSKNRHYIETVPKVINLEDKRYLNTQDTTTTEDKVIEQTDSVTGRIYRTTSDTVTFGSRNGEVFEAPMTINGNFTMATNFTLIIPAKGMGMAIWGDLNVTNGAPTFSFPNLSGMDDGDIEQFNQIPYLYVDGCIENKSAGTGMILGSNTIPLNIFAGSINTGNGSSKIYSDIYCLDADATSYIGGNGTTLEKWISDVVNKTGAYGSSDHNASFYTKGSLCLNGGNGGFTVPGDLIVEGDLIIESGRYLDVQGNLVVGGSIIKNGTLNCPSSRIYSDGYVEENSVMKSGYTSQPNVWYDIAEIYDDVNYERHENDGPKSAIYDSSLTWFKTDDSDYPVGFDTYYYKLDYYGNRISENGSFWDNRIGSQVTRFHDITTSDAYTYFDKSTHEEVSKSTAGEATLPAGYAIVDVDGNVVDPNVRTTEATSYFDESGNRVASVADAYEMKNTIKTIEDYKNGPGNGSVFPAYAEKEVILGFKQLDASTPIENTQVLKTVSEIEQEYKFEESAVTSIAPDDPDVANAVESTFLDASTLVDTGDDQWREIGAADNPNSVIESDGNCTIKGTFKNKTIKITAKSNVATWVKLDGTFNLDNSVLMYDDKGIVNPGMLYIFVDGEINMSSAGRIVTSTYQDLFDNKTSFWISTLDHAISGEGVQGTCPNITIYSNDSGNAALNFNNTGIITACIEAPYLDLNIVNTLSLDNKITYNGAVLNDYSNIAKQVGVIGILNCKTIAESENNFAFLYTPKSQTNPPTTPTVTTGSGAVYGITYYDGF